MALHRISCLGALTLPDTSGSVFFEPYPIRATNDFWKHGNFVFTAAGSKISLYSAFRVPNNYVASPTFYVEWTSVTTTGSVIWEVAYRSVGGDDTTSLDQATAAETLTIKDAAPTATDRRLFAGVAATASLLGSGSMVEVKLSRDGTSASNTMAASAQVFDLVLEYSDA